MSQRFLKCRNTSRRFLQGPHKLPTKSMWLWGPLKCTISNCNPVHVFLHFGTFGSVVLQLILASKLSELEQFEKWPENCLLRTKLSFLANGCILRQNSRKLTPLKIQFYCQHIITQPKNTFFNAWQWHQFDLVSFLLLFTF